MPFSGAAGKESIGASARKVQERRLSRLTVSARDFDCERTENDRPRPRDGRVRRRRGPPPSAAGAEL